MTSRSAHGSAHRLPPSSPSGIPLRGLWHLARRAAPVAASLLLAGCAQEELERVPGENVAQATQDLTFVESSGLVSIEAENFTNNTPQGSHAWTLTAFSGASGGNVMVATPNSGAALNSGYTATSPRLDYQVTFAQSGTYRVWVRGRDTGSSAGNNDSVHVGLNGAATASADRISSFSTSLGWTQSTMDNVIATLNVPSAGVHTVNVWMREDGFSFDKLVLTQSTSFTPSGTGPAETPDSGPPPTCTPTTYEAESMSSTTGGSVTGGWNIWSNGNISTSHTFVGGASTITVTAQGTLAVGAWPHMVVSVGGTQIGDTTVNTASWADYTFPFTAAAGSQTITVAFDNDYYDQAAGEDRNLIVDKVVVACAGSACTDDDTQPGTTTCGLNGRGVFEQLCVSGAWEDTPTCLDGDVCVDDDVQAGTTACGLNDRGTLDQLCVTGQWQDSATCDDPDECVDTSTQTGPTACGLNGRGGLEQLCTAGTWQDTATCVDPDECVDDASQAGTTACGFNGRGLLDQLCVSGAWTDTATCVDPDVCVDDSTQAGTTACGLNGRGVLQLVCTVGAWVETATCLDPDECVDDSTQQGAACGLNGRGTQDQLCVSGTWTNTGGCNDPDVCLDDSTQPGTASCGLNGRGALLQVCVTGQWQDSAQCDDPDVCVDDATQAGTTACGLNGRGALDQLCVAGAWTDTATCVDPDVCVDDATQAGTTACGLNDRGTLDEVCVTGQWQDSAVCDDPDECIDTSTQTGATACGLNGRGGFEQVCTAGTWQDTATCVDPDECVDDSTGQGGVCGLNGRGTIDQLCVTGTWTDTGCSDPDECVDDDTQPGTTPCGSAGALQQVCTAGQWVDSATCVESDYCGNGTCGASETCSSCATDCGACSLPSAVYLEAELGTLSGSPTFNVATAAAASGGEYITASSSSVSSPGPSRAAYTFAVASGTYRVWLRGNASSFSNDSLWLSVDGGSFVRWNDFPQGGWVWDDAHNSDASGNVVTFNLSAGTHTLTIANRESGFSMDKLYITSGGNTPSGLGGAHGVCGDALCDVTEDCSSCASDCGSCIVCTDGAVQPGATACGVNGRGALQQLCVGGAWTDTATCVDPDECVDDDTQPGTTACGLNDRGTLDEICAAGQWQDSTTCDDPDECVDTSTQTGSTACGLNGRGGLEQVCTVGTWEDTAICIDPDECVDGATQVAGACGLNGRGTQNQSCVGGSWANTTCDDTDVCVDGATRSGTTPCGAGGTLDQVCTTGQWVDGTNCVEGNVCGDSTCGSEETCSTCAIDCGVCSFAPAVYLEAELGTLSGSPTFSIGSNAAASGGAYIAPTSNSTNSAGPNRAAYTFTAAAGTYRVWMRANAPSASDDSVWFSMDGGTFVKWNDFPGGGWVWDDGHNSDSGGAVVTFNLTQGTHTLTIANREDGVSIDKFYVTSLGDTPSGLGGSTAFCGDAICAASEDCGTCESDCGACADSDADGVGDQADLCPNTPLGTAVDEHGCEVSDWDGDGVGDFDDQCPWTQAGDPVDANGCSIADTDGDGVVDSADDCPGTLPGTPVDQSGCPFDATVPEWTGPPPPDSDFQTLTLATGINEPMEVEIAADGQVYIIGRNGEFYAIEGGSLNLKSTVNTDPFQEGGLIGFALDPSFVSNRYAYFHYTHPVAEENVVSRITINANNTLNFSSESVLLTYGIQMDDCCHAAGELEFDTNGNLFISTGDNTRASDYAPIDERPGWSVDDAQKSSSNTNDLRGKILRITPTAAGGYTIPAGNLFTGDSTHRPEIYVMGNRNPFRISIDAETNELFWGEIGADANSSSSTRGPTGYDEINRAPQPGNYGWPYFAGFNEPYNDYNFATGQSGPQFNPNNVINNSPNNTGATNLPNAQGAWVRLSHRATMVGGVYRWDGSISDAFKLPSYFHGRLLYWNFNNDEMFEAPVDSSSPTLRQWLNTASLAGMIDATFSPANGRFYLLGYGGNCCNKPSNAGMLVEVRYVGAGGEPTEAEGYAINAAGSSYVAADGTTYAADTLYSGGEVSTSTDAISGTSDPTIYQTHRWQQGGFSYVLPLVNDDYQVTLQFADTYFDVAGERSFHVDAEGQRVITALDLVAVAGPDTAYDVTFDVTITDGALNLDFVASVENPLVSAIRVKQASSFAIGSNISLQAGINAKYVTANAIGAAAAANGVSDAETFTIVDGGAGTIALRSVASDLYLSVGSDSEATLSASASSVTLAERFELIENLGGFYVLRASANGAYVTASNAGDGPLTANGTTIGGWQVFDVMSVTVCQPSQGYGVDCRPQAAPYLNMPVTPDPTFSNVPAVLSQTGAFSDVVTLQPTASLIPFQPISPLWSDRAVKTRWISVPSGDSIFWEETGKWDFPPGTVFVKHFELPVDDDDPSILRRIETRLIVVQPGGTVYGVTYRWRADESDADLLTTIFEEPFTIASSSGDWEQIWTYPGPGDCLSCHNDAAQGILGAKTASLNSDFAYPSGEIDNQLRTWNHLGLFDVSLDEADIPTYPAQAALDDTSATPEHRLKSYWDINCGHCHGTLGIASLWDARYDTPLAQQGIVSGPLANQRDYLADYGLPNPFVVDPGNPANSILYVRDASVDPYDRMPPLARAMQDPEYLQLLEDWINAL